jgi:REP element-mobilizing transposase RayT
VGKCRNEDPKGGITHVYARGNDRCAIFRDDADREMYLRMLGGVLERTGARCLAYCLMTNHVHLVIQTREGNLAYLMQLLHSRYAQAFNRRHKRVGHLFQGRYGSTTIEDDGHLCMTLRYVELNPVTAHMCVRPEHFAWSSCRATLGRIAAPRWLNTEGALASFEWLGGDPCERYAAFVEPPSAVTPAALDEAPWEGDRRELVRREPGEEPRLDLGEEAGELLTLGGSEVAAAPAPQADELDEPSPLARVQPPDVVAGEERDLGDGEQLEDGEPP